MTKEIKCTSNKILKMNLLFIDDKDEKMFKISNVENENDNFNFSLLDETTHELENFINYLLGKILENYTQLEILIDGYENMGDFSQNLSNEFKKIWEKEFAEIVKDWNSF